MSFEIYTDFVQVCSLKLFLALRSYRLFFALIEKDKRKTQFPIPPQSKTSQLYSALRETINHFRHVLRHQSDG